jgi:hypothetical protein
MVKKKPRPSEQPTAASSPPRTLPVRTLDKAVSPEKSSGTNVRQQASPTRARDNGVTSKKPAASQNSNPFIPRPEKPSQRSKTPSPTKAKPRPSVPDKPPRAPGQTLSQLFKRNGGKQHLAPGAHLKPSASGGAGSPKQPRNNSSPERPKPSDGALGSSSPGRTRVQSSPKKSAAGEATALPTVHNQQTGHVTVVNHPLPAPIEPAPKGHRRWYGNGGTNSGANSGAILSRMAQRH